MLFRSMVASHKGGWSIRLSCVTVSSLLRTKLVSNWNEASLTAENAGDEKLGRNVRRARFALCIGVVVQLIVERRSNDSD